MNQYAVVTYLVLHTLGHGSIPLKANYKGDTHILLMKAEKNKPNMSEIGQLLLQSLYDMLQPI